MDVTPGDIVIYKLLERHSGSCERAPIVTTRARIVRHFVALFRCDVVRLVRLTRSHSIEQILHSSKPAAVDWDRGVVSGDRC
jgi:hypothetical protein